MYHRKHIGSPVYRRSGTWSTAGWTTRGLETFDSLQGCCSLGFVVGLLIRQSSDWSVWVVCFCWLVRLLGYFFAFFHWFLFCSLWWIFNELFCVAHGSLPFVVLGLLFYFLFFFPAVFSSLSSDVFCASVFFFSSCVCVFLFCFCRYYCLQCTEIEKLKTFCLVYIYIELQLCGAALSLGPGQTALKVYD